MSLVARRLTETLPRSVGAGGAIAYHSGMSGTARAAVRKAFLAGRSRCVVTTTALALGVNLPASHVVVRAATFLGEGRLGVDEILQMLGRAGGATPGWGASSCGQATTGTPPTSRRPCAPRPSPCCTRRSRRRGTAGRSGRRSSRSRECWKGCWRDARKMGGRLTSSGTFFPGSSVAECCASAPGGRSLGSRTRGAGWPTPVMRIGTTSPCWGQSRCGPCYRCRSLREVATLDVPALTAVGVRPAFARQIRRYLQRRPQ
jgi:hypothetical protein